MKLFDRLRRSTGTGATAEPPEGSSLEVDERDGSAEVGPTPTTAASRSMAPAGVVSTSRALPDPGRYDPTHPCHAPVSGVDLVLFAQITQRLRVAPADERGGLLAEHGHTAESWSAVNTVWMARLGQMPYLCATFDEASRLA
jgi:hypothetical protein